MENTATPFDCIVVGGGPAGLSAALVLGRCRRRVLLCDTGKPRNARSRAVHGFLSRDGMQPKELLAVCRDQLRKYTGVEQRDVEVLHAKKTTDGFVVELAEGKRERCRAILLATGIVDELPSIEGIDRFYGRSVHHCPYCDGWEHRDGELAVLGGRSEAVDLAIEMLMWSKNVYLCTNGESALKDDERKKLTQLGIPVMDQKIESLEGDGEDLSAIVFTNGSKLNCDALFFSPGQSQCSPLAEELGCKFCEGEIESELNTRTCVPRVFAAGNASKGLQLVIFAAAEGTRAAFEINEMLFQEDMEKDRLKTRLTV